MYPDTNPESLSTMGHTLVSSSVYGSHFKILCLSTASKRMRMFNHALDRGLDHDIMYNYNHIYRHTVQFSNCAGQHKMTVEV